MNRHWRGSNGPALMALDLTSAAVRLMQRTAAGGWQELGAAPLDGGFSERIDELRVEALVRGRGAVPVDLWLPSEQVLARHYDLPQGARGETEALRRLSAETGFRAGELWVAHSPMRQGVLVTVLALPAQTVSEARDYVRRWGFQPGRVSTRPDHGAAAAFGPDGPGFERPRRFPRAYRAGKQAGVAAAAAVLIGVAGWGASALLRDPGPAVPGTAPVLAAAIVDAGAPGLHRAAFTQVRRDRVQTLAVPRPRLAGDPLIAKPVASPAVGMAPDLPQPAAGVPMNVGPGPIRPGQVHPPRLDKVVAVVDRGDFAALVSSMNRLRDEAAPLATRPATEPLSMVAVTMLSAAQAAVPAATPAVYHDGAHAPGAIPGAVVQLAAATMAPRSVPAAPPPRPESAPEAEAEPEAKPAPEAEAEAKPEAELDAADPVSALAAIEAPRPAARPEKKAQSIASAAAHRAFGDSQSPANVRQAAARRGLELDSTSLIGVLDARSGRQALLRTQTGQFLKVARGDTIEGWRVSAINRDAVRLTRGSQNRTLLLVLR